MRALPERELIWWVQKAIWVSCSCIFDRAVPLVLAAAVAKKPCAFPNLLTTGIGMLDDKLCSKHLSCWLSTGCQPSAADSDHSVVAAGQQPSMLLVMPCCCCCPPCTHCHHHQHANPNPTPFLLQLVEGFTFVDHFSRTYPTLFVHKCQVGVFWWGYYTGRGSSVRTPKEHHQQQQQSNKEAHVLLQCSMLPAEAAAAMLCKRVLIVCSI